MQVSCSTSWSCQHSLSVSVLGLLLQWWNTMTKAKWGGKGLFGLHFHSTVHHWRKSGRELKQVRKPGVRSWCRGHEGVLLIGLLFTACSACFLVKPRATILGVLSLIIVWALPYQSLIKKMSYSLAYSLILWRHFLSGISLVSDDASLCQVDIKLASTMCLSDW